MMDAAHSNMQILTFRIQTCSVCAFQIQILTFVVGHLLGLHGKGSHHKTHVDFWLLEDCACWRKWVCLWARAGLPAYDQGVLVSMRTVGERKFVIKLVHQPAVCVEVQISLLMLPHTHTALPLLLEGVCERVWVRGERVGETEREYACVCVSMYACVNEISGTHPLSGCLCLPCHWSCLFYIPSISLSTSPQSPDCHPINSSVPLHVSASMSLLLPAPVFSPIRLSRSVSLSVWWGMGNCTLLHRKRQRQRRERWGKRGGQNSREGKREEEEEMRKLGEERGEGEEKRKRRQRQIRRIHKRQGRQSEEARGWEGKTVKERDGVRWGVQEVRGDKGGIDWSVPPFAIQQANSLSVESAFAALSLHAQVWQVVCVCVCMRLCACNYSARGWVMDKTLYVWHSYVLRNAASHLSATASTCCIRHVFVLKSPDELINYTHTRTHRGHTPSTTIHPGERCQSATQFNSYMHSLLPSVTLNPLVPSVLHRLFRLAGCADATDGSPYWNSSHGFS